jgi:uncharacterized protein DUF6894
MSQVYFHCTTGEAVVIDRGGTEVVDLADVRALALVFVDALIATPGREDWRAWVLHVRDEDGEEIFRLPFASVLRLH